MGAFQISHLIATIFLYNLQQINNIFCICFITLCWNEKDEKRLNSKFKNKPCMECRILPICGGGCTQQALEHEGVDYCVMNFDEDAKIQVVRNKFRELIA